MLNESLGLTGCNGTPQDKSGCYRLPTSAEWEYAARGGTSTLYSFGDDSSVLGDYGWYSDNSGYKTHKVGMKKANPKGLYDVHGNVQEWVQDQVSDKLPEGVDPLYEIKPDEGFPRTYRILRGGSWGGSKKDLQSASRNSGPPENGRDSDLGFRLVKTL